jgi:hypothetical protein
MRSLFVAAIVSSLTVAQWAQHLVLEACQVGPQDGFSQACMTMASVVNQCEVKANGNVQIFYDCLSTTVF